MASSEVTGKVQRVFRARYKISEPGLISHITQRAAGKDVLFLEDRDYLTMLGLLSESVEKFCLDYYAVCLMLNHIHILLKPHERNLAEAMRSIFSRYASAFNRRYERRGHLFGGPYRQAVCLDSTYLLTASVYIHLNPVRTGLSKDANAYRWSSCSLYCQDNPRKSFINPEPILQLVHGDGSAARRSYEDIVEKGRGAEPDNALEQEGAIETFCVRLAEMFPTLFKKLGNPSGEHREPAPSLMELTELECRLQEIRGRRARSPESKEAKRYLVEQLLARGYKKTEIAERLRISRRAVYNILDS